MALGVTEASVSVASMTNARCADLIRISLGNVNPMTGVPGRYYTVRRAEDLRRLVLRVLCDRAISAGFEEDD